MADLHPEQPTAAFRPEQRIASFHPPKRALMGAGPAEIHPRVIAALGQPAIGVHDPAFVALKEELKGLLRYVFQTRNTHTFPVTGPGTGGMECTLVSMVSPGEQVIVCRNGTFSGRMVEIIQRVGGVPIVIDVPWGEPVDAQMLEDALKANPDVRLVAFVHAETSAGVQSDVKTLVEIAHRYDALALVDAVASLGGTPVLVDAWGVDVIYSGSQKCLSSVPGIAPVSFSDRALEHVKARSARVRSWLLDASLAAGYWAWNARTSHHTAPTHSLFALHEALLLILEEGLEAGWARYARHHLALKAGLEALGLEFLVAEERHRMPQVNAVRIPLSVQAHEAEIRKRLISEFNLEIGAGIGDLSGKIWRIGLLGHSCREDNVRLCLFALGTALRAVRYPADPEMAVSMATQELRSEPAALRAPAPQGAIG